MSIILLSEVNFDLFKVPFLVLCQVVSMWLLQLVCYGHCNIEAKLWDFIKNITFHCMHIWQDLSVLKNFQQILSLSPFFLNSFPLFAKWQYSGSDIFIHKSYLSSFCCCIYGTLLRCKWHNPLSMHLFILCCTVISLCLICIKFLPLFALV